MNLIIHIIRKICANFLDGGLRISNFGLFYSIIQSVLNYVHIVQRAENFEVILDVLDNICLIIKQIKVFKDQIQKGSSLSNLEGFLSESKTVDYF